MGEYALFNLRMIRDQGSQAEQTKKLVKKMQDVQDQSVEHLAKPSEHMVKFTNNLRKLDII